MKTVHKFEIHRPGSQPTGKRTVPMPQGATLLHVGVQNFAVVAWALVDPDAPVVARTFLVHETGAEVDEAAAAPYLGIARLGPPNGAEYILHVFDGGE